MPKETIEARIATARSRLAANLGELQERVTRVKEAVSPATYLGSPWLKVGVGIAIGLIAGRRSRRAPLQLAAGDVATEPSSSVVGGMARSLVRAAITSIVGAVVERTVADLTRKLAAGTASDDTDDSATTPRA